VSSWLPASERVWRDKTLMKHHRQHHQLLRQAQIFSEAFRAARIPCIALKGPVFAERIYPVPFLKNSSDLDLLVGVSAVAPSVRLLESLGARLTGDYPWIVMQKYKHHLFFAGSGDLRPTELHYFLKAGANILETKQFFNRAVTWQSAKGAEFLVLSPADEVFYLIVHAAGHAFQRLRWLYDALALAKTLDAPARADVRALALKMRLTGYFVAADMACREFFGEGLPIDLSGFPTPWLWSRLRSSHLREMARREDYKFGLRALDDCRMSGTPASALRLCLKNATGKLPLMFHQLTGGAVGPDVLSKSLEA
jgi:hypothetical protein